MENKNLSLQQAKEYLDTEIISRQATLNIGLVGHVAHGKSTLIKCISGIKTMAHSSELKKNMTINLGYANAKIYRGDESPIQVEPLIFDTNPSASEWSGSGGSLGGGILDGVSDSFSSESQKPKYKACPSNTPDIFTDPTDNRTWRLVRHVSFVDCPGHEAYSATMMSGTGIMDAAFLVVAANAPCPQPQTLEHLSILDRVGIRDILIVQNKADLVTAEHSQANYQQIRDFTRGSAAENSPVIPICGVVGVNVDTILEYIVEKIEPPRRDLTSPPTLDIIRSFDVNKPGTDTALLKGGVLGGSLKHGILRIGDEVEVRPGIFLRDVKGEVICVPIITTVLSIFAEKNSLPFAVPGGLIGVGTNISPMLTSQDKLVGQVVGIPHNLPEVFIELKIKYRKMKSLTEAKLEGKGGGGGEGEGGGDNAEIESLRPEDAEEYTPDVPREEELLKVNIGTISVEGKVVSSTKKSKSKLEITLLLSSPVCVHVGAGVSISREISPSSGWKLCATGKIIDGKKVVLCRARRVERFDANDLMGSILREAESLKKEGKDKKDKKDKNRGEGGKDQTIVVNYPKDASLAETKGDKIDEDEAEWEARLEREFSKEMKKHKKKKKDKGPPLPLPHQPKVQEPTQLNQHPSFRDTDTPTKLNTLDSRDERDHPPLVPLVPLFAPLSSPPPPPPPLDLDPTPTPSSNPSYEDLIFRLAHSLHLRGMICPATDNLREEASSLSASNKLKIPNPILFRIGTKRVIWTNFSHACRALNRSAEHFSSFFLTELGVQGNMSDMKESEHPEALHIQNGRITKDIIHKILNSYINKFLKCPVCLSLDTRLVRDGSIRRDILTCTRPTCCSTSVVSEIQEGYHAVTKADRRTKKFEAKKLARAAAELVYQEKINSVKSSIL